MGNVSMTIELPASLKAERNGKVAILRLARAKKRNALNDKIILGIERFFSALPAEIGAVLLAGEGATKPRRVSRRSWKNARRK
jgi:enoyl-CoA hydratase/carnithine racemase